jgi:hypothetical protein
MELVKFNVKNIKYALPAANGTYGTPATMGYARSISLEANTSIKNIFGDGLKIASIVNDKGKTGSFTTNVISVAYEIAMGRKLQTANGLADIKQAKSVEHALYFETEALDEATGAIRTAKTWLLGVVSSRPSESFDQTEDDINESTFETPIEVKGAKVTYEDDTDYRDENGNEVFAWQVTATPDDADYATFGDAVVLPKMPNA